MMQKLWIVEAFNDTDIPTVSEYSLIDFTKEGWPIVKMYGEQAIIRKAPGRHIFMNSMQTRQFISDYLERRMRLYEKRLNEIRDSIQKGVRLHVKPENPNTDNSTHPISSTDSAVLPKVLKKAAG
jgi:hypothetical protein